jgi:hypothetical protein
MANTTGNGKRTMRRKSASAVSGNIEPGVYFEVPFDEYLSWPLVNNTLLSQAARSLAHFRFAEQTDGDESTAAMRLGSIIHAGVLEPESLAVLPRFEEEIRRKDGSEYANPKATTAYKQCVADFEAANAGKRIASAGEHESIVGIRESIAEHDRAAEFMDDGSVEVSIVWDDANSGIRLKARLDKWSKAQRRIVDLKTSRDASDFERSIFKYAYHRQASLYVDGIRALTGHRHEFAIVAVETEPPYCVRAAPVSTNALEDGRTEYKLLLQKIAACRRTGEWPAYENPDCWDLPDWFRNQGSVSLNVSGRTVTL